MNLVELLLLPADVTPDRVAVADGDQALTFAELPHAAAGVADLLEARGIGPGDVVATTLGFSTDFVALTLGTLLVGAAVAPLSERAKSAEVERLVASLRPALLVTQGEAGGLARAEVRAALRTAEKSRRPVERDGGDLAVVLHTSGTTGTPKPVRMGHEGIVAALLGSALPADGSDKGSTLLSVPNHHVAGLMSLFLSLYAGRRVELLGGFTAEAWLDRVGAGTIDHAFVVPTMLQRILASPSFSADRLGGLRTLAYGAAPMPAAVIGGALERFPRSCSFVGSYGQTETGGTVCILTPEDHAGARDGDVAAAARLRSIGRPVEGVEMTVLDETGVPAPPGASGEIALRRIERGEVDWHRTGDQGYVDEAGYLFLTSRLDDLIIRAGENIDPAEVEEAIGTHVGVAEVAVAGLADEEWGQVVAAFVVPSPGHQPSADEITAHAKGTIASFKAPTVVRFVDALPRTDLGKVKRRALAAGQTEPAQVGPAWTGGAT